jgi:hypothetical protein
MSNTIITRRSGVLVSLDPVVKNNANIVVPGIGVSALSRQTIFALNKFVKGCRSDGTWSKMIEVNCFLTDPAGVTTDNTLARAPLILGPDGANSGLYSWGSGGFSNTTINGSLGNGTNGALLNLRPSNAFPSANSAGITLYVSTMTASGNIVDCGAFPGGSTAMHMLCNFSGSVFNGTIWSDTDLCTTAAPGVAGFYSESRTASNVLKKYFANSTNAFAQAGATITANNATWFNSTMMMMFAGNNGASFFPSARRYSFAAWHAGLTDSETQSLYNRVQTLRISLGGGFV